MRTTPSIPTMRRVIAVTLSLLFALTSFSITPAFAGGAEDNCGDGYWLKYEVDGDLWETGPAWPEGADLPDIDITPNDDWTEADWTSDPAALAVWVSSAAEEQSFAGGLSGHVTGKLHSNPEVSYHQISHIAFCFDEPPPAPTGSLTVVKEVVGDHDGGAFDFAGTCQLPQFPAHAEFSLADGDSWTFPERIPSYLDGSPCAFEETDTDGADSVTYRLGQTELVPDADGKVHFTLSSTQDLVLTVTNTFEPERPQVLLEKAWFADADDTVPTAIFRRAEDGWTLVGDGPDGHDPPADFEQPTDFDATVTYGEETYTVAETLPDGWQNITCPADAPQPNGLGTFPYERPDGDDLQLRSLDRLEVAPGVDTIRHTICNAPIPEPLVPSIGLTKTPDVATVTYAPDDGDDETVGYTYAVTNTGETTLTGLVLVDDVLGTITLADTDLDPGESTTGTATHVVTAADAAAGEIVNEAEVSGLAPDETEVTATDDATVLVEQVLPEVVATPEIDLEKTALVELDDGGRKVVAWSESAPTGTQITYEYVITNTGETPLAGIMLVDDVLGTITLTDTDLAVGASMTVTATHVVTATDADAGSVTNEAVVTATDPSGTGVEDDDAETVFITAVRAEVIDRDEVEPEVIDRDEELPVTGAATMTLALAGLLSLATGAGLLRASRREE